ncbi:MAG: efflux RND transporter periplasmic adaptor subunit [Thermodesulfovibrionales bacterium]|nr:efflux RND transporter periplasmic adaptor subunit [Thermodesulfovibrionales bacterium]
MIRRIIIIITALILSLAIGGFFAYKKFFQKPSIKIIETAKAERGTIRGVLVASGIIKPQVGAVVKVGARATGTIVKMNVRVGDRVKKGQLIALIDDREIQKLIEQQKAAIKEAEANYQYSKINYERQLELIKYEYTTQDQVDKAKNQLDTSLAILKERTASLLQTETRLSYTRIYAPIDGVVSEVTAQEGETIVAGLQVANLVTVMDPSRLEMWIYIDETEIGRVKLNQNVEYYVDTFPDKLFKGNIEKIYPQPVVKDNIVYYLCIVKVSSEDSIYLRPEMTANVRIIFEEKEDILTVPNSAIKFEKGRQVAYKVTGVDGVERVEIKVGLRGENRSEIVSGLKEGDTVATKLILPVQARP